MFKRVGAAVLGTFCVLVLSGSVWSANLGSGSVELKSAGPLAFGPDGVLLVGDAAAAAIYAIETGDTSGNPDSVSVNVKGINQKIADALGTSTRDVAVVDMAVNPNSGNVYLSVRRGEGPDAAAVLLRVSPAGDISEVSTKNVKFAKAALPNAPAAQPQGQQGQQCRRRRGGRAESITDLAFVDGQVIVAGLSNEEFASTLRSIPYPFSEVNRGAGVRIFHGAHGRFETNSPVRTFTTYEIQGKPHLLAGYTCTPLVKFPLSALKPGAQVQGVTVAELGNRNRPLDMFIYNKDGADFILMANSARGVMKITTEGIANRGSIEEKISGTAGQTYDTIEELKGVTQLDRLNAANALVMVETDDGAMNLLTVALP